MSRAKYYVFTINNPTEEEESAIAAYADQTLRDQKQISYIVVGIEVGESGTRHLQGYVELSQRLRLTQLKRLPGFARGHFEVRRGSAEQAAEYCLKDNNVLVEAGSRSSGGQGSRSDLVDLQNVMLPLGSFF